MNSIAWAIVFVALIFYERLYNIELDARGYGGMIGAITLIAFVLILVCTTKELLR